MNHFIATAIVSASAPYLTLLIIAGVVYLIAIIRHDKGHFRTKLIGDFSIVLYWWYPYIVEYIVLEMINCKQLSDSPVLFRDMDEQCYQGTHLLLVILVTVPSIFVYMLLIPYLLVTRMSKLQ